MFNNCIKQQITDQFQFDSNSNSMVTCRLHWNTTLARWSILIIELFNGPQFFICSLKRENIQILVKSVLITNLIS